ASALGVSSDFAAAAALVGSAFADDFVAAFFGSAFLAAGLAAPFFFAVAGLAAAAFAAALGAFLVLDLVVADFVLVAALAEDFFSVEAVLVFFVVMRDGEVLVALLGDAVRGVVLGVAVFLAVLVAGFALAAAPVEPFAADFAALRVAVAAAAG